MVFSITDHELHKEQQTKQRATTKATKVLCSYPIFAEILLVSFHSIFSFNHLAWESAFTGEETCPSWAPTGALEQHISGDISFAFKQYWDLTRDKDWLASEGKINFALRLQLTHCPSVASY